MLLISKTYWLGLPFAYKEKLSDNVLQEPVQLKAADLRDSTAKKHRQGQRHNRTCRRTGSERPIAGS